MDNDGQSTGIEDIGAIIPNAEPVAPAAPAAEPATEPEPMGVREAIAHAREEGNFELVDPTTGEPVPDPVQEEIGFGDTPDPVATKDPEPVWDDETPPGEETPPEGEADPNVEETTSLVVKLPGREADDPDIEIEVEDEFTAERLRQLHNGFARKSDLDAERKQVMDDRRQLQEIDTMLESDPAGFILEKVAPATQQAIAMQLLADDKIYAAVLEKMQNWEGDDNVRRADMAELKVTSRDNRDAALRKLDATSRLESQVGQIQDSIKSLIPNGMSDENAALFMADAERDVAGYVRQNKLKGMSDEEFGRFITGMPTVLGTRLRLFGIDPSKDAQSESRASAGEKPAEPNVDAQTRGAEFRTRAVRRAAATTPGAGAGIPSAAPNRPPPNIGIKEAIAWERKNG